MNWITNYVRPKFDFLSRKDMPENLWIKDPESGEMVFHKDLEANQWVVPSSGHHLYIPAKDRLGFFFDDGAFEELPQPKVAIDPLKFKGERKYTDKLKESRNKTKMEDSILAAFGKVQGIEITCAVHEFKFMGGSLGMAAGEAIVSAMERAVDNKTPFIMFTASGGARMQEGILSLMQLPRTTVAVQMLKEAGLPYIVVMTNPTTGGVSASYAMLGDIHIAEPGSLIGFAGQRVIEQIIREKLPEGFQRAEYLQEHGMVDMVVPRTELRATIGNVLSLLLNREKPQADVLDVEAVTQAVAEEVDVAQAQAAEKTIVEEPEAVAENPAKKVKPAKADAEEVAPPDGALPAAS